MSIFSRTTSKTPVSTFGAATTAVADITGKYTIDPSHTRLGFQARHAMVTSVRGSFEQFEGTATIDTTNPASSSVNLSIDAGSVGTGVADRDGHLKSADFFDVETYPEITFVSTEVEREGSDWAISGDLTVKDTTNPSASSSRRPVRPRTHLATCGSGSKARHRQPQGLGTRLERRTRNRGRARFRQSQTAVRRIRNQERLTTRVGRTGSPCGGPVPVSGECVQSRGVRAAAWDLLLCGPPSAFRNAWPVRYLPAAALRGCPIPLVQEQPCHHLDPSEPSSQGWPPPSQEGFC